MNPQESVVVVAGHGEVGQAISALCQLPFRRVLVEDPFLDPPEPLTDAERGKVAALHVAFPGEIQGFVTKVYEYSEKYSPDVILIHSTTIPGTTDFLVERLGEDRVVHSQVQGKHAQGQMCKDMLRHPKFVATRSDKALFKAINVLRAMGHSPAKIVRLSCPLAGELSKLLSTSLYAYLIVWAQEMERLSESAGVSYADLSSYLMLETDDYRVDNKKSGVIGGHCLIPNLEILQTTYPSALWKMMLESNERRMKVED